jgi:signal transduction histidine kinase
MNHELRTPLNAILGFSELIAMDEGERFSTATYREYAQDIYRSGTQLLAIINDILDFSKAEAGQLVLDEEIVDAGSLVADSIRSMLPVAAKKSIRLESAISPAMPHFRGDGRRLRQVLLNLLSNAVKFTPDNGTVLVRAMLTAARQIELSVEDTGIGIPQDKIRCVTEPFFQVDGSLSRQQEGTGLGLSIAKSLTELHQGELVLTSETGRGTKVSLLLPEQRIVVVEAA